MAEETTLLAHLVPRITNRIEDTATDALAFILNKSENCREEFNALLRDGGFGLEPVTRFQTQVTYEDGSRPDMNGYDKTGTKRLNRNSGPPCCKGRPAAIWTSSMVKALGRCYSLPRKAGS